MRADNEPRNCDDDRVDNEAPEPVVIPPAELSAEALRGVIESFVLREGTEYGEHDVSLEAKVRAVQRQLDRGEAVIMFEPASASIHIVPDPRRHG